LPQYPLSRPNGAVETTTKGASLKSGLTNPLPICRVSRDSNVPFDQMRKGFVLPIEFRSQQRRRYYDILATHFNMVEISTGNSWSVDDIQVSKTANLMGNQLLRLTNIIFLQIQIKSPPQSHFRHRHRHPALPSLPAAAAVVVAAVAVAAAAEAGPAAAYPSAMVFQLADRLHHQSLAVVAAAVAWVSTSGPRAMCLMCSVC
jgi:hypothetical protein